MGRACFPLTHSRPSNGMSSEHQSATGTATRIKNGRFTIHSNRSGEHRTFQIKTVIGDKKKPKDAFCNKMAGNRIVGLLTGPDNESSYTNFGFVNDDGIRCWRAHSDKRPLADILWRFAVEGVHDAESGRIMLEGVDGYMLCEGKCIHCNRTLTTPESIESGIGPVCAGRAT